MASDDETIIFSNNEVPNLNYLVSLKGLIVSETDLSKRETVLLQFLLEEKGIGLIAKVPGPIRFSNSDFIPYSKSLSFFGVGLNTEQASVRWMLKKDVLGSVIVAMVRDLFDRSPHRMHLRDVIQFVDPKTVLVQSSILGKENLNRRLVTEYVYFDSTYEMTKLDIELEEYLKGLGFKVIPVSENISTFIFGNQLLVSDDSILSSLPNSSHSIVKKTSKEVILAFQRSSVFRKLSPCFEAAEIVIPQKTKVWDTCHDTKPQQATHQVLMVAPIGFHLNAETAVDNYFMNQTNSSPFEIEAKALKEFSLFHHKLVQSGVLPILFYGEQFYKTPDAVFPNNWFSTHTSAELKSGVSTLVFYPMKSPSRRAERRKEIIDELRQVYKNEISLIEWENSDLDSYLESTGALVLDHVNRVAYATLSQRCSQEVAQIWAKKLDYELILFHCTDSKNLPIYHTNVVMCVGTTLAVVCMECISTDQERAAVRSKLESTGHTVIDITRHQMENFCGNVLELKGTNNKRILVMSTKAYNNFTQQQLEIISKNVDEILHCPIETIESVGGGGVRCMLGELF